MRPATQVIVGVGDMAVSDNRDELLVTYALGSCLGVAAWDKEAKVGGLLRGLDLLAAWVAHDRLHLRQLAGTLARLWATRWAPLRADYAGPIPYAPGARAD